MSYFKKLFNSFLISWTKFTAILKSCISKAILYTDVAVNPFHFILFLYQGVAHHQTRFEVCYKKRKGEILFAR